MWDLVNNGMDEFDPLMKQKIQAEALKTHLRWGLKEN